MSRIGKQPITVPAGVQVAIQDDRLVAKGPKGKVEQRLFTDCPVKIEGSVISFSRQGNDGPLRARHGLVRALVANAVRGVHEGFSKTLDIVGVGYRGEVKGREIHFALGYSHPVVYALPEGIEAEIDKNNKITVRGADRQRVGQVAAEIRNLRPPDPYKAKGIRYSDEQIRRKVGKAGGR